MSPDEAHQHPGAGDEPRPETPAQLEEDIETIREHLDDVAGELDRRRHRVLNIPRQLRRHAGPIALGAALAAVGLGIWWWRARRRRRVRTGVRALLPASVASGRWFDGARERVAQAIRPLPRPHPVRASLLRVSTAGAGAAASVLGKHLAGRAVDRARPGA